MTKWVKATGRKPDALIGQCPSHGDYIIWTTWEVEHGTVKEFPVCPAIEYGELNGLINIVEIFDKPDVVPGDNVREYHDDIIPDDEDAFVSSRRRKSKR